MTNFSQGVANKAGGSLLGEHQVPANPSTTLAARLSHSREILHFRRIIALSFSLVLASTFKASTSLD
jgi:hypothetical protein